MYVKYSDKKLISCYLGDGVVDREWAYQTNFGGNGYVHHLDCDDGFTGILKHNEGLGLGETL